MIGNMLEEKEEKYSENRRKMNSQGNEGWVIQEGWIQKKYGDGVPEGLTGRIPNSQFLNTTCCLYHQKVSFMSLTVTSFSICGGEGMSSVHAVLLKAMLPVPVT